MVKTYRELTGGQLTECVDVIQEQHKHISVNMLPFDRAAVTKEFHDWPQIGIGEVFAFIKYTHVQAVLVIVESVNVMNPLRHAEILCIAYSDFISDYQRAKYAMYLMDAAITWAKDRGLDGVSSVVHSAKDKGKLQGTFGFMETGKHYYKQLTVRG